MADNVNRRLARLRLIDYQVAVIFFLMVALIIVNAGTVLSPYLDNATLQYVFLALVLFIMSILILAKALGTFELRATHHEEYRSEGQLSRMARRVSLASRGFPFTQDMLRGRLETMFRSEGITPDEETGKFLTTPIEGKGPQPRRGAYYMRSFVKALGILEEKL